MLKDYNIRKVFCVYIQKQWQKSFQINEHALVAKNLKPCLKKKTNCLVDTLTEHGGALN